MKPIVIISCGAKKRDKPCQAQDMYIGSYFKMALRFAKSRTSIDNIFILSAKYGLIRATDMIAPYEMRITSLGATNSIIVTVQAESFGILGHQNIQVVAGKDYNFIIKSVFPNAINVVEGQKGMGYQMQHLKRLVDASAKVKD